MTRDAFDELAEALRDHLVTRAREGAAAPRRLDADIRDLVEREAAALTEEERANLAERVLRLTAGLGPPRRSARRPIG